MKDDTNMRQAMGAPIRYEALTELSEVIPLASEWDALLEQSQCNRAFSCSKWFLATSELFPAMRPLVLIARRDCALVGVMPLVIDDNGRKAGFPRNWCDYHDIISYDGHGDVNAGLLDLAISGTRHYDKLSLKRIRQDSNCFRAAMTLKPGLDAEQLFLPGRMVEYTYVDLAHGFDVYRKKILSKKFRNNLRTMRNNARKRGIAVRELKPDDLAPEKIAEVFLSLHLSRFGGHTALRTSVSFVHRLFPSLFAEGRMRVFALLDEARIIGMHVAMVGKHSLFGWNGGFLPEAAGLSPGSQLFEEAIRQACLSGYEEYDFGWGDQEYKAQWTTDARQVGELEFTTRNQLPAAKSEILNAATARAVNQEAGSMI
jgi:CelD/BcsL family acetyltransferase involved in cellulose biosynthesis